MILHHNGEKMDGIFWQLPQELMTTIFNELGNSSAQIRLMCYLIGTKEGFDLNKNEIQKRTGLKHDSYIRARQALEKRGWIKITENQCVVNYESIRSLAHQPSAIYRGLG